MEGRNFHGRTRFCNQGKMQAEILFPGSLQQFWRLWHSVSTSRGRGGIQHCLRPGQSLLPNDDPRDYFHWQLAKTGLFDRFYRRDGYCKSWTSQLLPRRWKKFVNRKCQPRQELPQLWFLKILCRPGRRQRPADRQKEKGQWWANGCEWGYCKIWWSG